MHERFTGLLKDAGYSDSSSSSLSSGSPTNVQSSGQSSTLDQVITTASQNIVQLSAATQTVGDSISANTQALDKTTESREASSGGVMGTIQQATTGLTGSGGLLGGGLLGSGLGLLFDGIKSLFGGGSNTPPPLTEYLAPPKNDFELATSNGVTGDAVYNSYGQPRTAAISQLAFDGLAPSGRPSGGGTATNNPPGQQASSTQNITVHVQAMDSRSFLDHSADIASAVRQAMLNMHSINDVVNDL